MPTCFIVQPIHPVGIERLREGGVAVRQASAARMEVVAREIGGCEAAITRDAGLDAAALEAGTALRFVTNHGTGTNRLDVEAAERLGIPAAYTPGANARSVAEHAIALILAVARRVPEGNAAVRAEGWAMRYETGMVELRGRVLGLAGFGAIGRMTADIARLGFGMTVLAWSPSVPEAVLEEAGAERAESLEALLRRSDVVSLHRPLTPETERMIGAAEIAMMKPDAILINTARGGLVDTAALAAALRAGHLAGAGIDVFPTEPPGAEEPLLAAPRAVLAPHLGGATEDAMRRMALLCADQVLDALAGRRPAHLLRPDSWERRRR